jgi:hypothetical protein
MKPNAFGLPHTEGERAMLQRLLSRRRRWLASRHAHRARNIHDTHAAESETLAQHLETIGESIKSMFKDAAEIVRGHRVITESNAEVLAGDILNIGNDEGNRQNVIVSSLLDARAAVDKISALTKEKK